MRQRGSGALARDERAEDHSPAVAADPMAAEPPSATRRRAASSAVLLVLALIGFGDTVVTQVVFSGYAVSGGGANKIAGPPLLVAFSLIASGLVGLLLALPEGQDTRWRLARPRELGRIPGRVAAWGRRQCLELRTLVAGWRAGAVAAWETLAALRRGERGLARASRTRVVLLGLAVCLSLAADLGAIAPQSRPLAQWAWIASVAVLVVAAGVAGSGGASGNRHSATASKRALKGRARIGGWKGWVASFWRHGGDWLLVGVLLAGALALRLPDLTGLPYVVHGDEAWNGLEALRWLHGGVPSLLSTGWYGLPVAGYGVPALVMHFAGANLWGLRLSSVLVGALSIALLYALAREFTGRRVAFLAAALMTVSHLHIQFSRMGIHYVHGMTVVVLVLWLLVRALRRGSAVAAVLAAAGMSLALQVYFSARIVFVIVPLFLLGLALVGRAAYPGCRRVSSEARWALRRTTGWLALGLVVAVGPLAIYFQQDLGALTGRPAEVLILNLTAYRRQTLFTQFGTTDLRTILARQLAAVPLLPGGLADTSLQYGPHYAMLDPLVAALVLVGFWYALCTLRRPLSLLLVLWVLGVVTLGGVLTIDMPWWPRLFAMLPALCLLAALAMEGLLGLVVRGAGAARLAWTRRGGRRWLSKERPTRAVGIARTALGIGVILAVVGFSLAQTLRHYYTDYPKSVNTDTYRTRYTDLAYYAATLPSGTRVVLFDTGDLLLNYSTIRFLAPRLDGVRVETIVALRQALAARRGPVVVILPILDLPRFEQALATPGAIPAGTVQDVRDPFGVTAFYTYTIGLSHSTGG